MISKHARTDVIKMLYIISFTYNIFVTVDMTRINVGIDATDKKYQRLNVQIFNPT